MSRTLKALISLITFSTVLAAQTAPRRPPEGVWKVVEIVGTGADASKNANPQPSLFIFTRNYYSMMLVPGTQPRSLFKDTEEPTNQEKTLAFDSFVANTGKYEVMDSTLTFRPIVARYPNFMADGSAEYQFRIEGNTLWLTGAVSGPKLTRLKLVRVE
jgi:hypothetical protein